MARKLGFVPAIGILALVLGGCSGSDGMSTPAVPATEADVTSVMQTVVLPMIDGMVDLGAEENASSAALSSGEGAEEGCTDFSDFCLNEGEGSAEFCGDQGDISWTYQACERPRGLVDGTLAVEGNLQAGSTSYDLTIGDLVLAGSVGWEREGFLCWERTYDGFSAVSPDHSTTIDGHVRSPCFSSGRTGHIELEVQKPGTSFSLDLDFDAQTGTATLVSDDGSWTCEIDMASGEADCEEI